MMAKDNDSLSKSQKKKLWWQIPFLLFLVLGTFYIVRQQHSMPYQKNHGVVFGTFYNVTYQFDTDLQQEIEAELQQVDQEFSMFNQESTVSKINRGETPKLNSMFLEVYRLATQVNADTDGAFDITVAPLVNVWGFGFKHEEMPSAHQVDSLLEFVDMKQLQLDEQQQVLHKKDERTMLDFSAIAKGYGSDCVARLLQKHGVKNYMVEIGGEVVTNGISPSRVPWRVGVSKPVEDSLQTSKELQTVLNVTDLSMATSGNYRNFYYKGGRKYAHTIDPQTGYPVQHSILSATVLAKSCALADAYATSFMVLGLEKAKQVLERHPELMAYFIYSDAKGDYAVWYSPSLKEKTND